MAAPARATSTATTIATAPALGIATAPAPAPAPMPLYYTTTPAPAPAPAPAPTPPYYTMVLTQKLSTFNTRLLRYDEYLIWIVANMSSHEQGPLFTSAQGSEAREIVKHEAPLGLPPGGRTQFVTRLFFQPQGLNGLTRCPMQREYFEYEFFQAQNNLSDPVITRVLTPPP